MQIINIHSRGFLFSSIVQWLNYVHISTHICDAMWENLPHVAQGSFAEITKLVLKLLVFFISY